MIGLVVGHVPCALDHQRRLREARSERVARSVAARGRRTGGPVVHPPPPDSRGEDVWQALRF